MLAAENGHVEVVKVLLAVPGIKVDLNNQALRELLTTDCRKRATQVRDSDVMPKDLLKIVAHYDRTDVYQNQDNALNNEIKNVFLSVKVKI